MKIIKLKKVIKGDALQKKLKTILTKEEYKNLIKWIWTEELELNDAYVKLGIFKNEDEVDHVEGAGLDVFVTLSSGRRLGLETYISADWIKTIENLNITMIDGDKIKRQSKTKPRITFRG